VKANETTTEPSPRATKRHVRRTLGVATAALLALSACSSNPGPKRVAQDIIETESLVNPLLDKDCLLRELDKFTDEELTTIGKSVGENGAEADGAADLAKFEAALRACVNEG
jgi:hypothetical protein